MTKKNDISIKNIIVLSIVLVIIGIAIIISIALGIFKTNTQAQLNTLEAQQVALSQLNKANTESLKVNDKGVLVRDLNQFDKAPRLAKLELQNKNLLAKDLKVNDRQLLLTTLNDRKGLLRNDLTKNKNLLALQSSVKSHLVVDVLALSEVV